MAIYPDKRAGITTGRWRVELTRGTRGAANHEKYRQRHLSHEAAIADEERVKALWAAGEGALGTTAPAKAPSAHCIASVTQEASGTLWKGSSSEACSWAHIRVMGEIIGAELPIDEIETPHLTKAIRELGKMGKKDATINRYLSHFRTFLIWAADEGFRKVPVANIKFRWQKEPVGRIRWITPEEEAQLEAFLPKKVWWLVKVAIETGCRRDELLTLEPRDVNGGLLHLWKTKTDSPRTIPISQETAAMLHRLLLKGGMPTKRGLRSWWDRAKAKMGLEDDTQFVFHVCRHTCATRLVDQGENLLVIKEWMGHKRIETTQRYAHVKPSNLQDALNRRGTLTTTAPMEPPKAANNDVPQQSPTEGGLGLETPRKAA
jgi:integrase